MIAPGRLFARRRDCVSQKLKRAALRRGQLHLPLRLLIHDVSGLNHTRCNRFTVLVRAEVDLAQPESDLTLGGAISLLGDRCCRDPGCDVAHNFDLRVDRAMQQRMTACTTTLIFARMMNG